ncbi:MAG: Ni/Fe hydrogenase subunit alpha [Thaumarchaeota archaeon]|jgi:F420-non-reducing hydrogenase large subunit|nr:Ni/Fe hydrogenase subunit alpha [Candidatus Terraquivivens yellowstonensis]MCL7399653.1 Ni/Fe hydrogenase subunit alpha [Candidatus Terraquivivens yellowstonensis]
MKEVVINPITRLEGHGKIVIILDDAGNCVKAYLQIPELRGFEIFAIGRHAEDMPQITSRICGVCPTAHHMASTKALDDLYKVEPPEPAKKIREMFYNIFMLEDHALHFYILAGPDFIVGPKAPKEERNVVGVIKKVGTEVGLRIIQTRKKLRKLLETIGGKTIHPVLGLPGGISKPLSQEVVETARKVSEEAVQFAEFTYKVFKDVVLANKEYVDLITSEAYTHRTYYMGLVDEKNRVNFYDGKLRVVSPRGIEHAKFDVHQYLDYIAEHVEPWTYIKFPYLKKIGWKGLIDGEDSGVMSVAPLARLNAADGMATPRAQEAYEEMYQILGGKPVHHTLANHWARVIEIIYAAERFRELAHDPDIESKEVRNLPTATPEEGIGVVEAPRGTLIHHYQTDQNGVIKKANLLVATQHNAARIALSVDKAARNLVKAGQIEQGILNMVEMAFRSYDPCHACGTHSLPGGLSVKFYLYDTNGQLLRVVDSEELI